MTISLHQASIPVFLRALDNLRHVLQKGEVFAVEKGIEPEVLLQQRLIVDMLPLVRNVQIACDLAKNGACRLAGTEPPKFEDTETTFAQLYERIERVLGLIRAVTPGQVDGNEARQVTMQTRAGELTMDAQSYLLHFSIPNLFFHCTTAYAILREAGVPIGKMDFMGAPR
ncbi:MAG: DUF1993 domain-containing protein [Gammaproteobacteria bacterium]|nr:DUF1993 domain-containing protein [Gammaproteobacteria bacterium]